MPGSKAGSGLAALAKRRSVFLPDVLTFEEDDKDDDDHWHSHVLPRERTFIGMLLPGSRHKSHIKCSQITDMYGDHAFCHPEALPEGVQIGDRLRFEIEEMPGVLRAPRAVNITLLGANRDKTEAAEAGKGGKGKGKGGKGKGKGSTAFDPQAEAPMPTQSYSGVVRSEDRSTGNLIIDCPNVDEDYGVGAVIRAKENAMNARVGSLVVFKVRKKKADFVVASDVTINGFDPKVKSDAAKEAKAEERSWQETFEEEAAWPPTKKRKWKEDDWEEVAQPRKKPQVQARPAVKSTVVRVAAKKQW